MLQPAIQIKRTDDRLEALAQELRDHYVLRSSEIDQLLGPDGQKYEWLIDLRPLLLEVRFLTLIAVMFWERMANLWPFQVAGLETAAVPILLAIAFEGESRGCPTRTLVVRKKRKKYGTAKVVEGRPIKNIPVILVDDSINSARSINKVLVAIRQIGLESRQAFAVLSFGSHAARRWERFNDVAIQSLLSPADLGLKSKETPFLKTEYEVLWTFASPRVNYRFAVAKSSPQMFEQSLIFGSDSGILWSINALSGRINWWYDTACADPKGIVSTPLIVDGRVFFGAYSGHVFCLNARSGREIWKVKHCDFIGSSPCYANGHIYVGLEHKTNSNRGSLAKICSYTGELKWRSQTREMLHGSPVFSTLHSCIVVGTNDSSVMSIDAETGSVRQRLLVGGPVKAAPALYKDLAIFGSFDGKIYVWNFIENEIRLSVPTADIVYARPLIVDDRAYIGSADHSFHVIDLNQLMVVASYDLGEKIHSGAALVGDTVLVGTSGGELIGIDPNTLALTARYQLPERLTNTIVANGKYLYVYAFDNKLWAILPKSIDTA